MPYKIKHRPRARQELEECREIYPQFAADVETWLDRLAVAIERGDESISVDLNAALDIVTSANAGDWKHAAKKWWNVSAKNKARALITVLRKRCPPWQMRASSARITFLSIQTWEIDIFFEVDHTEQIIAVTLYDGLPGQSQDG